ncbi:MAG: TldD/PmbA family protein [Chloroflexi bacterium]|nr:TldD/PmbA family protein [Chloroflexota bacterium]
MSGDAVELGEKALRAIAEKALRAARGDQVEAVVIARNDSLTRFANAAIHQNVSSRVIDLRVRVVKGKRVATLATDRIDEEGIRAVAEQASALCAIVPENPDFGGLPEPAPIPSAPSAFVDGTARATPRDRALAVKQVCDAARGKGLRAAGFVSTNVQELAVASSLGIWAYGPQTTCEVQVAAIGDAGSAFGQRVSTDFATLDVRAASDEAIRKALLAQGPRDLAPGDHEVVLEPYAVYDIVGFLCGQLTGLAVEEGRSFVGGRLGQQVTGPVTIVDDPFDRAGLPRAFDFEGRPSQALTLIDTGVARAIVYDSATARRAGARPTGHALPANAFMPAAPMHRRLEAGTRSRDELIKDCRRGVLVTRFWYTRWVHQLRTIVTGMTRDGTFAIVDGEIAYPVKNFRFTQSYHEALQGVRGIGSELSLLVAGEAFGLQAISARVPALHLASFTFTGATQY